MNPTNLLRLAVLILFVTLSVLLVMWNKTSAAQQQNTARPQGASSQDEPKNLQVLKGMTRQQVITVMRSWTEALGVECSYCHVRPFEADTPRKMVARLMQRDFVMGMKHKDGSALSCQSCHQGHPNFLRTRPFAGAIGKNLRDVRVLTNMNRDQLKQVMNGFAQALGVKCTYCHASASDFDSDTPRKQVARFMMSEFTRGLVKQDGSAVNCADCHQGQARLLAVRPFPRREERRPAGGNQPTPQRPNP